jgi:hypothetical protein
VARVERDERHQADHGERPVTPWSPDNTDCVASTATDTAAVCRIDRNRICAPMRPFWAAL